MFARYGEHWLAFGAFITVLVPRKKAKPHHPQRWRGGDLYNYGDMPPHYPVPALYEPRGHFYWSMPAFPINRLIAGWYLWQHSIGNPQINNPNSYY